MEEFLLKKAALEFNQMLMGFQRNQYQSIEKEFDTVVLAMYNRPTKL